MPEYSKGKINGSNVSKNEVMIIVGQTNEEDLNAYIEKLTNNGYQEKSNQYCKGLIEIEFQFNTSDILQISVYQEEKLQWPKDMLGDVPPLTRGDLTSVSEPSEETGNYGDLYFINLTEDDIEAWESVLVQNGFEVSSKSYSKANVKYKGKAYSKLNIDFQSNGDNEWILYFGYEE